MPIPTATTSSSHHSSARCRLALRVLNDRIVATLRHTRDQTGAKMQKNARGRAEDDALRPFLAVLLLEELEVGPVLLTVVEPDHELPAPRPVPLCLPDVGVDVRAGIVSEPARVGGNRLLYGVDRVRGAARYRTAPGEAGPIRLGEDVQA